MMNRFESRFLLITTLLAGGSGVILHVMKEWLAPVDPFAVINHPWQPWVLKLHVVSVPFLVLALGMALSKHAFNKLRAGQYSGRRTGMFTLLLLVPMVLSGVLIQVITSRSPLRVAVWVHLATGVTYLLAYLAHALSTSARDRRAQGDCPGLAARAVQGRADGSASAVGVDAGLMELRRRT